MRELTNAGLEFFLEPGVYRLCLRGTDCRAATLAPNAVTMVNFHVAAEGGR
jgi:hypothetical protein